MLCIDNSEWARNGDYAPSRFDAQRETLNFLAAAKIQSNPETTVGLLSLAGDRVEVHISPTRSPGSIMTALAKDVRISGESANFLSGLKTASLALKNRQNKTQRQRIILLAGSPVRDDVRELIRLAKGFKKNSVAVDVINFGAENAANENAEKWEQFIEAVNAGDNSHLVNIPPGPHILSDMVLSSAIMQEEGRGGAGGVGGASGSGGGGGGFDIDPNQDPEMAMAIRMSMEEERARQQRMTGETAGAAAPAATAAAGDSATAAVAADAAGGDSGAPMEDDEEALLQQAIAMSMQQSQVSHFHTVLSLLCLLSLSAASSPHDASLLSLCCACSRTTSLRLRPRRLLPLTLRLRLRPLPLQPLPTLQTSVRPWRTQTSSAHSSHPSLAQPRWTRTSAHISLTAPLCHPPLPPRLSLAQPPFPCVVVCSSVRTCWTN